MASQSTYRLAATIDTLLLWGRLGGGYALVAFIAFGLVLVIPGLPAWVGAILLLLAIALALVAILRLRPFLAVRKNGVAIEGRVTQVDERRTHNATDGGVLLTQRMTYQYEVEGKRYTGRTTWGSSGRFGTLGSGMPIPLIVDPARPGGAMWVEDMPIRMPQLIGM